MTIQELSTQYRLRTRLDADGVTIIPGKGGEIYEYSEDLLGVLLITPATKPARARFWRAMCGKMVEAGMTLNQNGDTEGSLLFAGDNPAHVKLAMRLAGIRPKRKVSPQDLERLRFIGAATRHSKRDN